jgi:cytochrome c peroxidase
MPRALRRPGPALGGQPQSWRPVALLGGGALAALLLTACADEKGGATRAEAAWGLPLPEGFPTPVVPAENPATPEKFAFGRALFYEPGLSGNGEQSCADCHDPALAFTDGLVTPTGSTGDPIPRNSMALVNVAWLRTLTWPNPMLTTLEDQLLIPMFNDAPTELGMSGHMVEISARLSEDAQLVALGEAAFPKEDPFTEVPLVYALATFVRGLISSGSAYDRFEYGGDPSGMSDDARRGMALFFSEQTECYHCHSGLNFTASFVSTTSAGEQESFFNTGLYNLDGQGAYPAGNQGLYEITGDPADMGRFRVPTLRNVALTGPYMHDGSIDTLEGVIEHYNRGGRLIAEGEQAGDGATSPLKSDLVFALNLTDEEKAQLLAFLGALTDTTFTEDPDYGP